MSEASWNEPARVDEFARKDADHRLVELLDARADSFHGPVLDLGCAGGRNLRALAVRGVRAVGLDLSPAMLDRARQESGAPVVRGRMNALPFADAAFLWVVALGIYHCAQTIAEWEAAIRESTRVLAPGGRLLLSSFAPGTILSDGPFRALPGAGGVHETPGGRRALLLDAAEIVERLRPHGLVAETPPETVERQGDDFRRVVVNGVFRRTATVDGV